MNRTQFSLTFMAVATILGVIMGRTTDMSMGMMLFVILVGYIPFIIFAGE